MHLIVGLGNPGAGYARTRHNIGFRVIDRLAAKLGGSWHRAEAGGAEYDDERASQSHLILLKPQRFMNNSGGVVSRMAKKFRLTVSDIWVVVDDIDLPFGELRLRLQGSSGGHHGLDSIIAHVGSRDFPRLRIGVGPKTKPAGFDAARYVLHNFSATERKALPAIVDRSVDALLLASERGFAAAMNVWNRKGASKRHP